MKIYTVNSIKECLYHFAFRNEYDVITNEVCKELFQAVISNQSSFSKSYPEHGMDIEAIIKKVSEKHIEKTKNIELVNYDIQAFNAGYFAKKKLNSCVIKIEIALADNFSEQDYESFNYTLYESVRHEIEHNKTFSNLGKPQQEYITLFDTLFKKNNTDLVSHCRGISKYILHPHELPSYAKSIYYYAKKSGKDFQDIIVDVLNRAFFNNDVNKIRDGMSNSEVALLFNNVKDTLVNEIDSLYPNSAIRTTWI